MGLLMGIHCLPLPASRAYFFRFQIVGCISSTTTKCNVVDDRKGARDSMRYILETFGRKEGVLGRKIDLSMK